MTLDAELFCLPDEGRPDFARLRRRLTRSFRRKHPAMLQVFDVLHVDGHSTRPLSYAERRALLKELELDGPAWRSPASVVVVRTEDFVSHVARSGSRASSQAPQFDVHPGPALHGVAQAQNAPR